MYTQRRIVSSLVPALPRRESSGEVSASVNSMNVGDAVVQRSGDLKQNRKWLIVVNE